MRLFIRQAVLASVCIFLGLCPVHAKKKSVTTGFEGKKTSPNLTLTLSTGNSKSGLRKSSRSRRSGGRSGRRRKMKLTVG